MPAAEEPMRSPNKEALQRADAAPQRVLPAQPRRESAALAVPDHAFAQSRELEAGPPAGFMILLLRALAPWHT
jgi:hypothetical protein